MIKMLSVSNACLGEACLCGKGRCVGLEVLQFCFYRSWNKEGGYSGQGGKGKRFGKNQCFPNGCYYLSPLSRAGFADLLRSGSGETSPEGPLRGEEVGSEENGLMWTIVRKTGTKGTAEASTETAPEVLVPRLKIITVTN